MNPELSTAQVDALLDVLERGIVRIRVLAAGGDARQAEALADALHNLPRLLREGHRWGWTVTGFRELFLTPLVQSHPELAGLEQPLDAVR